MCPFAASPHVNSKLNGAGEVKKDLKELAGGGKRGGVAVADLLFQFGEAERDGGVVLKAVIEPDGDELAHPGEVLIAALGFKESAGGEMRLVGEDGFP